METKHLPEGIAPHEGKELSLMLAGKKHVALFEWVPAVFLPYLDDGTFHIRTMFLCCDGEYAVPSFIVFAPSHLAQVDELAALLCNQRGFDPAHEYQVGRILGYEDWQIEAFIQYVQRRRDSGCLKRESPE